MKKLIAFVTLTCFLSASMASCVPAMPKADDPGDTTTADAKEAEKESEAEKDAETALIVAVCGILILFAYISSQDRKGGNNNQSSVGGKNKVA
jgi:hypothetical protein